MNREIKEKIIKGLQHNIEEQKLLGKEPQVLNYAVHGEDLNQIQDLTDFYDELKVDKIKMVLRHDTTGKMTSAVLSINIEDFQKLIDKQVQQDIDLKTQVEQNQYKR